jgi:hypothetical protein
MTWTESPAEGQDRLMPDGASQESEAMISAIRSASPGSAQSIRTPALAPRKRV